MHSNCSEEYTNKVSEPSALNWMDGHQRFGDTCSFHLQDRKYFLMRHMIINLSEAVYLAKVDKFQGYFSIPS